VSIPKLLCKFEIGYKEQHREINNRYLLDESIKSGFNLEKNTKLTCANQNLGVERLVNHEPYVTISSDLTMPNELGNLKMNLNHAWGSLSTESRLSMFHRLKKKVLINTTSEELGSRKSILLIKSETRLGKIFDWSKTEQTKYAENNSQDAKYTKGYSFNNFH